MVGRSSKQTGLKSVDSTYCVPRNILIFTGFSSTALLTCSLSIVFHLFIIMYMKIVEMIDLSSTHTQNIVVI